MLRTIAAEETAHLIPLLQELADAHNACSLHGKGTFPRRDTAEAAAELAEAIQEGQAAAAVIEENGKWQGFCAVLFHGKAGSIRYLVVQKEYRRQGLGRTLMDWAMDTLRQKGIHAIEVKVIAGNLARVLYEAYGFQIDAVLLRKETDLASSKKP